MQAPNVPCYFLTKTVGEGLTRLRIRPHRSTLLINHFCPSERPCANEDEREGYRLQRLCTACKFRPRQVGPLVEAIRKREQAVPLTARAVCKILFISQNSLISWLAENYLY